MKRWMGAFLALVMVAALCPKGWAANEPYVFEEWDMEVTVPEGDYYILLRDMDPESQTLADVGMTAEQVNEIMATNNIYLDALNFDASYDLAVTAVSSEDYEAIFDFAQLSEKQKDASIEVIKKGLEQLNCTIVGDISWYEGEEALYMVLEVDIPEWESWAYQYVTVYNGRMIAAKASSTYLEAPTEEIKEQVRLLAEGIHFTKKLPVPQEVLDTYEKGEKGRGDLLNALGKTILPGAVCAMSVYMLLKPQGGEKNEYRQ